MSLSRSPYASTLGPRRCSRGTLYTPAVSGCPCCKILAQRTRRVKMLPATRRCRACAKTIIGIRHHNQHLHPQCREAWQEAEKERTAAELRQRWKTTKPAGSCSVAACRTPVTSGAKCDRHRAMKRRQDQAARERRKRLGVCKDCRKPARPGGMYCEGSVEKVRVMAAAWREKHRAERYWLKWPTKTGTRRIGRPPKVRPGSGQLPSRREEMRTP